MNEEADRLIAEGNRAEDAGRLVEACERYRAAIVAAPRYARAHLNLGIGLEALADAEGALGAYETAYALDGESPYAMYNLGKLLHARGDSRRAEELLRSALRCKPDFAEAGVTLAAALASRGEFAGAATAFEDVLARHPEYTGPLYDYASVLAKLARWPEAEAILRRAIAAGAGEAGVMSALGGVLARQRRFTEAASWYRQALALDPGVPGAVADLTDLGRLLAGDGHADEAFACFETAASVDPRSIDAHIGLGSIHADRDQLERARSCFARALELDPENVQARWALAMTRLPAVYAIDEEPAACRLALAGELEKLAGWLTAERRRRSVAAIGLQSPFYLAYQEENNRDLLRRHGELCVRVMSEWLAREPLKTSSPSGRQADMVRVGVVSSHFQNHSVWLAIVKGWFEMLDRRRFPLEAFYLSASEDQETRLARSLAARFHQGPKSMRDWVQTILEQKLDVLIYPEIGMDPLTVKLASLRLAPVQVATWGHAETTGLPTIDFFLSAEALEPKDADANYTERLIRLPGLGCHYQPLRITPAAPDLARLGIDAGAPILICPGVPFKYAPGHDGALVEVTRRLGRCNLVFFEPRDGRLAQKLRARLRAAFARQGQDADGSVRFVPWQNSAEFHGLLRRADVMLDTIGFSGFNTAMQAVECSLPIVTREGRFLRGRLASGILRRMGLSELVVQSAEAYAALAVRIATDRDYRTRLRERIDAARPALFGDQAPIAALERFLSEARPPLSGQTS